MKLSSLIAGTFVAIACTLIHAGAALSAAPLPATNDVTKYNVTWNTLSKDYNDSMPVGNGDIGLNLWTEQNGDVVFLIGKTDAYTENGQIVKLGRVRLSLSPNPFAGAQNFTQTLDIQTGRLELSGGPSGAAPTTLHIWVDANHPVIHIYGTGPQPATVRVAVELWRTAPRTISTTGVELAGTGVFRELVHSPVPVVVDPDTVLPAQAGEISWCHFNSRSTYPEVLENQHLDSLLTKYPDPLLHRAFGAEIAGAGFESDGNQALQTTTPVDSFALNIYALTEHADTPVQWQSDISRLVSTERARKIDDEWAAHVRWWSNFWNRSWIDVTGTPQAAEVSQSYAIMRYMDACGGRGAIPIKYNGSIFTVGQEPAPGQYDPVKGERDADYRNWGGNFWAQNQRQIYWPMVNAGDYDLLAPYFAMYRNNLPMELDRTRLYFGHAGASYPETMYFWGTPNNNDFGWGNPADVMTNTWIRGHIVGGVETVDMMLTVYDNTQDLDFARQTLLPVADAVTTFYDVHWPRDANGKIHMDPAQAIETYQHSVNPTPDIAGLMNILPRLLALPTNLTTQEQRARWAEMLANLPPIPIGKTGLDGKMPNSVDDNPTGSPTILPAEKYDHASNVENPELYTVFPFHIYGVGLPDLTLAQTTFGARRFLSSTCWGQDGEEAALLGLTDAAEQNVVENFTRYGWQKFKWFWDPGHDWIPDMDNGGAGMETLQLMIMQCDVDGKRIQLLPTWPADWSGDFKLHAPRQTTIEGTIVSGQLTNLNVTPSSRRSDIVMVNQCPLQAPKSY